MQKQFVEFNMQLPVAVRKEGKWWISRCEILDVYSQGPDKVKALANLVEALQLFLESCFERGTLDQVLRERGFRVLGSAAKPPSKRGWPSSWGLVNVPLPFMIQAPRSNRCRA